MHTKAVVVLKDGQIVAERYAEGYGIDTPILGFSATKSVISALVGILVRKGALTLDESAPVAAWQDPGDPRDAITVDHLLRHTAGLAIGSSLQASLASAFEPVNRMKFMESDMAGPPKASAGDCRPAAPGITMMAITIILSHLIRNAVGGHAVGCAALRAAGTVRSARHAPRDDRVRCIRQSGRIEPDVGDARATGRGSACSISMTAWSGESASFLRAG